MENSEADGEKFFYKSQDINLCAIFNKQEGKSTHGNVVLTHGIINDKDEDGNFVKLAKKLNQKGYNVLRFDFRGHGDSEGISENVTIAGELVDLETSIQKFDDLINARSRYIIVASSFGAVSSILYTAANSERIDKIVLWNPVLDFERTFLRAETPWGKTFFNQKGYEELKKKGFITVPETEFRFGKRLIEEFKEIKPYQLLRKFELPVLTIHGTEDTAVPYSVSKQHGTPNKHSKFISHKCDHSFVGIEDTVIDETVEWITENDVRKNE